MWRTVPFLNVCISIVAFVVAFVLIVYMLIAFVAGSFDVGMQLLQAAFMSSTERQTLFAATNVAFIYNIAYLMVLMKAYTVLAAYMRSYTVDVKEVVEMGIIVAVLELLFNADAYPEHTQSVLMILATAFFGIYAFRYHLGALVARLPQYTEPKASVEEEMETMVPVVRRTVQRGSSPAPKVKKAVPAPRAARKIAAK